MLLLFSTRFINGTFKWTASLRKYGLLMVCIYYVLMSVIAFSLVDHWFSDFSSSFSDIGIGQSQDDSIVGLRQTKHIPTALPVSGTLSSSNPDLLQSHHRILDFSTTPGEPPAMLLLFSYSNLFASHIMVMLYALGLAWIMSNAESQNEP